MVEGGVSAVVVVGECSGVWWFTEVLCGGQRGVKGRAVVGRGPVKGSLIEGRK